MRILHVITSLKTGGAEKLMVDLLPRLQSFGNEVELVVFDGTITPFYHELELKGIKIHSLRVGGSVYNPKNILALHKLMKGVDIVHTHNTASQLFAAIALDFIRKKNRPRLVTTEHNTTNRRRGVPLFRLIDRCMYSKYERIICISEQAKTNLLQHLGELQEKVVTIFNGIDVQKYCQNQNTTTQQRDVIVITMVAAFRVQKDQKTLIKAMALLPSNYELQLVGTGDSILMKDCQDLTIKLGIQQRVHFLGMRMDIPEILATSDIIVLSSHYEGLSLSSIEGMASGRPFVASDVDGLHEIVSGYGVLFPHEDERALSETIVKLSTNSLLSHQVAERCMERAFQYDIRRMTDRYLNIYCQIMH